MFGMTSMGAKVINYINDDHGPYVFKIIPRFAIE
jgi:hypothetical protein